MKHQDRVIVTDADNTLWDTNAVFAGAQLRLLGLVEQLTDRACPDADRLRFVRAFDQALAERHHLHLKYPIQMLVAALAYGLHHNAPDNTAEHILQQGRHGAYRLSDAQISGVVAGYTEALARVPDLLPTVRDGLELAKAHGLSVYVMTEGKIDLQRNTLHTHDLDKYVEGVWELPKTPVQFARLVRRFQSAAVVVIGDQPDRDIVPAHAAGCTTVLIPGRFQPRWQSQTNASVADCVVTSFLEAMQWIVSK
jgi:putative hydrolase of the HAD superfamily